MPRAWRTANPSSGSRQDFSALEFGEIAATGLLELGIDPSRFLVLRVAHAEDALRAASDALTCAALGAVVIEVVGEHKVLDLKSSRRLTLGAAETNVTAFLLRFNAVPDTSSAETRWMIRAARSNEQDENWGMPRFEAELVRNRHGRTGHWVMEWNCDDAIFRARSGGSWRCGFRAFRPTGCSGDGKRRDGAPSPDAPPLVVAAKEKNALVISALDRKATALGLRVGQPLANARAMLPALKAVTANEPADLKLLGRIADWCERFTPFVALDPPRGLLLDVTGATHLFGGEQAMLDRIRAGLEAQGFAVRGAHGRNARWPHALSRAIATALSCRRAKKRKPSRRFPSKRSISIPSPPMPSAAQA